MKPTQTHTPGPWIATEYHDARDNSHGFEIGGHPDHNAGLSACVCSGPDCEANAAFIVRACNSHAELLAALKLAATMQEPADKIGRMIWSGHMATIRAAIARATAQP